MPKCSRCGTRMWIIETSPDGLCEPCRKAIAAERKEAKALALRERNYTALKEHRGRPALQRIYDSFVEQYPNALITGVSVPEMDKKILIYLEGEPSYYATFDPLLNAAKIVSYQEAQAQAAAENRKAVEAKEAKERAQNSGCAIWLAVVGILYGLLCLVVSTVGGAIGAICSLLVLAGGCTKSRGLVIVGGALSIAAALFGFPFTIGFVLFGIFYICAGTSM